MQRLWSYLKPVVKAKSLAQESSGRRIHRTACCRRWPTPASFHQTAWRHLVQYMEVWQPWHLYFLKIIKQTFVEWSWLQGYRLPVFAVKSEEPVDRRQRRLWDKDPPQKLLSILEKAQLNRAFSTYLINTTGLLCFSTVNMKKKVHTSFPF